MLQNNEGEQCVNEKKIGYELIIIDLSNGSMEVNYIILSACMAG